MPSAVRLYKGGETSPPVYPSEVWAWKAEGWSLTSEFVPPGSVAEIDKLINAEPLSKDTSSVLTRGDRELELLQIYEDSGWSAIKAIAIENSIIDKPDDGWDAAIPLILDKEFPSE
ncbi:MAG: hypothetical protein AAF810_05380 [Cyanobacteria bacterium P01_D01_bin.36]